MVELLLPRDRDGISTPCGPSHQTLPGAPHDDGRSIGSTCVADLQTPSADRPTTGRTCQDREHDRCAAVCPGDVDVVRAGTRNDLLRAGGPGGVRGGRAARLLAWL